MPFLKKKNPIWQAKRTKDGRKLLVLSPEPVLVPITLDVFEKGCLLIGVDPDRFLSGEEVLSKYPELPLASGQLFLDLVLKNAGAFSGWRDWPPDIAQAFLAVVAANFLKASKGSYTPSTPFTQLSVLLSRTIQRVRRRVLARLLFE